MKRWLAVLLAGVMTFSLAACGDGGTAGGENSGSTGTGTDTSAEETNDAAKQHVYQYQELSLDEIPSGSSINALAYVNDKLYGVFDCWGDTEYSALYVANPDGTDAKVAELAQNQLEDGSSAYVSAAAITSEGRVYLIQSISTLVDAENFVYGQNVNLQCYDSDGNLIYDQPIQETSDAMAGYLNVLGIGEGKDSGVELLTYDSNSNAHSIMSFDSEGKLLKTQELGEGLGMNSGTSNGDGSWEILTYNSDYTTLRLSTYDTASGSFGEQTEAPVKLQNYSVEKVDNGRFLLAGQEGVAVWNKGDADITELMNSIESDLDAESISHVAEVSDTQFVAAYNDMNDMNLHIALFTKVNPEDVPDRQTLVLGGFYLGSDVRAQVINFNKNSSTYKITLKDYSSGSINGSVDDFITQLNNDIAAGNMPDILKVSDEISVSNLAGKGLLANVDNLIAGDSELSQAAFLDNVFEAYRIDGKLYQVIPFFNVSTIVGKKSVLGDITGWDMEEFLTMVSKLGDGQSAFSDVTRDGFLNNAIQFGGADYIDSDTGECHFDSDEFVNVLTYAATLPEEISYDGDYDQNQYRTGKTVLCSMYMSDFSSLSSYINGSFGEEIAYVGFPTADKNGSIVYATESYVISSQSANQDAAWEFLRTFLTSDYQNAEGHYAMPVEKNAFMAVANKALEKPYYLDEKGQKVEFDDTYYLNDELITLPVLTQEQLDQAVSFVESISRTGYQNTEVQSIINEEVQAFFEGQKSAKDVAGIIQNRVQLYLDENN